MVGFKCLMVSKETKAEEVIEVHFNEDLIAFVHKDGNNSNETTINLINGNVFVTTESETKVLNKIKQARYTPNRG